MESNCAYFFANVFGSDLVKKTGKHSTTAAGTYSFSINNKAREEDMYTVNFWMDISIRKGHYSVEMHDFTIVHQDHELEFSKRLSAARNGDGLSKQVLAIFHSSNLDEMKKVYKSMSAKTTGDQATASK